VWGVDRVVAYKSIKSREKRLFPRGVVVPER